MSYSSQQPANEKYHTAASSWLLKSITQKPATSQQTANKEYHTAASSWLVKSITQQPATSQ